MYPNNFFMPSPRVGFSPMRLGANSVRSGGLFSSLRSVNWGNLLNGASKTLNVVNQAIPIVKQAGPMVNNLKSMIKVASLFKDETDIRENKNTTNTNNSDKSKANNNNVSSSTDSFSNDIFNNKPNFFI